MKESNRIIADKARKLSMQDSKEQNPVHSDQVVDSENIEKIRKFLMERLPDDPGLFNQNKPVKTDKKQGSHSLSQLHFFQNHHK